MRKIPIFLISLQELELPTFVGKRMNVAVSEVFHVIDSPWSTL